MKKVFLLLIGIVLLIATFLIWDIWKCDDDSCFIFEWQKIRAADSFEHCVSLGFPVIELHTPECRAGGKSFPMGAEKVTGDGNNDTVAPIVMAAVRSVVAKSLKIREEEVAILSADKKEWPNSCLGLSPSSFGCVEAITPGYEVTARVRDQQFVYRTNADGSVVKEQ